MALRHSVRGYHSGGAHAGETRPGGGFGERGDWGEVLCGWVKGMVRSAKGTNTLLRIY